MKSGMLQHCYSRFSSSSIKWASYFISCCCLTIKSKIQAYSNARRVKISGKDLVDTWKLAMEIVNSK